MLAPHSLDYHLSSRPLRIPRALIVDAVITLGLVASQAMPSPADVIPWGVLALWALTSTTRAVRAYLFGILLSYLNPGIFNEAQFVMSARWLILAAAALRVTSDVFLRRRPKSQHLDWMIPFGIYIAGLFVLAISSSYFPSLSLLKLTSFSLGFWTVTAGVSISPLFRWQRWVVTVTATVMLASVPFIGTRFGVFLNGLGFQGLLNHPQAFGVFIAPVAALCLAGTMVTRRSSFALAACFGVGLILLSQARTALLASSLSVVGAMIIRYLFDSGFLAHVLLGSKIRVIMTLLAVLAGTVTLPFALPMIRAFLLKDERPTVVVSHESVASSLRKSRGDLVLKSTHNFLDHPWSGIGFAIPSTFRELGPEANDGVPTSYATEKGFLPTAALEETGLLGATLFLVFLFSMFRPLVVQPNIIPLATAISCLLINLGEMNFFSAGSLGCFMWFYIATARLEVVPSSAATRGAAYST